MNYRHSYHAGNFADVMKHALLCLSLQHLQQKPKPFFVLDTHAGVGFYDVTDTPAQKTQEWVDGIGRLYQRQDIPNSLRHYLELVEQANAGLAELKFYPGSPWFSAQMLRPDDRLILCELHPQDGLALAENFATVPQVQVKTPANGYQELKANLPPKEKRGMVLIDPPFEQTNEFEQVEKALTAALKRWQSGSYVVWYPIKNEQGVVEFQRAVKALAGPGENVFAVDFWVRSGLTAKGMNGCGMLFINPPYRVVQESPELMAFLVKELAQDAHAHYQLSWVTP